MSFPQKYRKKFDFAIAADVIGTNYSEENIFEEMLLSLRNGGIMIFTAQFSYLGNYWYSETLQKLEN